MKNFMGKRNVTLIEKIQHDKKKLFYVLKYLEHMTVFEHNKKFHNVEENVLVQAVN